MQSIAPFQPAHQITASQATLRHRFVTYNKTEHASVKSVAKRCLDITGALVGLGLTATVAVPITIAMKISDPGPLFYSQIRCGLHGRKFRIWKFRSMVVGADKMKHLVENQVNSDGRFFKNENDPRITRLGRFLRKTSLDEFPQFLNVLKGEMSLVGTRPPSLDEVQHYDTHHWARLNVKPGITGEWQVKGRSSVKEFEDVVKLDVAYQQKWSFWYDLSLLFKTVQVVLKKEGAC